MSDGWGRGDGATLRRLLAGNAPLSSSLPSSLPVARVLDLVGSDYGRVLRRCARPPRCCRLRLGLLRRGRGGGADLSQRLLSEHAVRCARALVQAARRRELDVVG